MPALGGAPRRRALGASTPRSRPRSPIPAHPPILLYPGAGARDVLRDPPRGPVTLVVVDGTWSQARTVVRDNPILQALPRYAFATPEPSQYRIRKEPRAEYCSTIEALMHVLGALEGDPDRFRALLDPLRAMVDAQLACQVDAPRRPVRARLRPRPRRWLVPDGADHAVRRPRPRRRRGERVAVTAAARTARAKAPTSSCTGPR